jgi:hypothetical protein
MPQMERFLIEISHASERIRLLVFNGNRSGYFSSMGKENGRPIIMQSERRGNGEEIMLDYMDASDDWVIPWRILETME